MFDGTLPAAFKVTESTVTPSGVIVVNAERAGAITIVHRRVLAFDSLVRAFLPALSDPTSADVAGWRLRPSSRSGSLVPGVQGASPAFW